MIREDVPCQNPSQQHLWFKFKTKTIRGCFSVKLLGGNLFQTKMIYHFFFASFIPLPFIVAFSYLHCHTSCSKTHLIAVLDRAVGAYKPINIGQGGM